MFSVFKKIMIFVTMAVFITSSLGSDTVFAKRQTHANKFDSFAFIKELTGKKYAGRQSGTDGYEKAVQYTEKVMKQLGIVPLLKENSYRQEYENKVAVLQKESLMVNEKKYEIMRDYMPNARTTSGEFTFDKLTYVGSGLKRDYKEKIKEVAVFKWNDENGKFPGGILDRVLIAKEKGAKAVFIVANGDLQIGNYEHPLNGNDVEIPVIYISEQFAEQVLKVPQDYNFAELPKIKVELSLKISRKKAKSSNLIGVIEGKNEQKAILITTNLDGFGSLPDGRYYENAKAGVVAAAMLLDLAKKYKDKKPDYNVIIAVVGSKWTENEGIKELAEVIDFNQIVATIDLYAMGGIGVPHVSYTDKSYEDMAKLISPNAFYNEESGNALASTLRTKTKDLIIIRDQETWIDDSLTDTYKNISKEGYQKGLDFLSGTIELLIDQDDEKEQKEFNYNPDDVKEIYEEDVNKTYTYLETKYYRIYFDERNKPIFDVEYMKQIDKIYERIASFNYYPYLDQKVKYLAIQSGREAAILADRKDLIDDPDQAGSGFASRDDVHPVIFCKEPESFSLLSHELNHLLANYKKYGMANNLQEPQGHSYIMYHVGNRYIEDPSELIQNHLQNHEAPNVIENARNYKTTLNWRVYTHDEVDPSGHINAAKILASMITYQKFTFGSNLARRSMYRMYDSQEDINEDLVADFSKGKFSIDDFLESWSNWMTSSGKEIGNTAKKAAKEYKDSLTQYDYAKIYLKYQKGGGNDKPFDGNIIFTNLIKSNDLKITSFTAKKNGELIEFELKCTSDNQKERGYVFFNPPYGNIIMKMVQKNAIKKGKNTIKIGVPVEKLKKVNEITIKFSDPGNKWGNASDMVSFQVEQLNTLLMKSFQE